MAILIPARERDAPTPNIYRNIYQNLLKITFSHLRRCQGDRPHHNFMFLQLYFGV